MASIVENSEQWGSVRVTVPASPFQVRGNGGTSIACRELLLIAAAGNVSEVRVRVGSVCTSITGIPCPKGVVHAQHGSSVPLRLAVRDVNQLYFIGGTENDVVDILWRN